MWSGWYLLGVALLSGCAAVPSLHEVYQYEKSEPPLTIYWSYVRQDQGTVVAQGIARNGLPRKFQFTEVEATLLGRDKEGRVVSRSVMRVPDFVGSETPFRVVLGLTGSEHAFDLRFVYKGEDIETNGGRN